MILPATYLSTLFVLVCGVLFWGSWANTYKMAGKTRYELYYYDFAVGLALFAAVIAFTFGSLNSQELTFQENLLIAGYRQIAWAVAAGIVFNLGNLFFISAVSLVGLALAFPIAFGTALLTEVTLNLILNPTQRTLIPVLGGILLVLAAVIATACAYGSYLQHLQEQAVAALQPDPRGKLRRPRPPSPLRCIVLGVAGGIFMGLSAPLLESSRAGISGVGPYGLGILFALGIFGSTIVFIPFFANFPVRGEPIEITKYFRLTKGEHLTGLLGGAIFIAGAICTFIANSGITNVSLPPATAFGIAGATPIVGIFWGLLAWRELKGSGPRVQTLLATMIVLYIAGVGMMAVART
jgi:glucose uptake protein